MANRFLDACARKPLDRPPVWLMRQAGRYLPEYRATREKAGGFLALCKTPELAAEVSLQPIRRFGFDAAIIFCDILIPAEAMGAEVAFEAGEGPRVRADLEKLREPEPRETCGFLYDALRIVRRELPAETALLGFAGAPFTVACYLIEGETSRGFERSRAKLMGDPGKAHALLEKIAGFTARYLAAQVEAGADAVQLFDTWAHLLNPDDALDLAARGARATIDAFRAISPKPVPVIYYGPPELGQHARADVYSLETRLALAPARARLPVVQGNLDPVILLAGPDA
ncbi:MAG TPA: uroporphyrinogen decarboxylase family protein, partial [Planctomycetota bacterium]|nr:uroporphyrinogen decarboxylase family protein [Planctomycetota bacterium]